MGQEIQKATAGPLTFQKQPEKFLAEVGSYLETIQLVYRSKLPPQELVLWRETLKDYSYQEFNQAMTHLISNPPKYELEDGTIQVWRGMPKLPDVVDVMLDFRDQAILDARKREHERERAELEKLAKRRDEHPEEFMGWGEFCERLKTDNPELAARVGMVMPSKQDLNLDKNAKTLRQQKEKLLKNS